MTEKEIIGRLEHIRRLEERNIRGIWRAYDSVTRRLTQTISETVPTLSSDDEIPADIYYAYPGAGLSPTWIAVDLNVAGTAAWDATEKSFYVNLNSTDEYVHGTLKNAWPNGLGGESSSFAPKNGEVNICTLEFRARFNANADYTVYGVGLNSTTRAAFNTSTYHFIQVTRNAGNWELGSCDGSTISQSSVAGGDGSWHDFKVEWDDDAIRLYVDDVLMITKTTNRPAQALGFNAFTNSGTNTVDLKDFKISWRADVTTI